MAIGKQVAEFAFKFTSLTYGATETEQTVQGNCEGTVKLGGETNPALGTLTTHGAPGATSGKCRWVGSVYLTTGDIIPSTGEGTWEQAGLTSGVRGCCSLAAMASHASPKARS